MMLYFLLVGGVEVSQNGFGDLILMKFVVRLVIFVFFFGFLDVQVGVDGFCCDFFVFDSCDCQVFVFGNIVFVGLDISQVGFVVGVDNDVVFVQ